jgi:hypothetical protein
VVFNARPAAVIPGEPGGLRAWVYGDGSGHFLNAWLRDRAGEVRQYTFGQVTHQGWQQMTAAFDDARGWPNVRISGADNGRLDFPASLTSIVLDGVPDGQASKGTIYIDETQAATGAAAASAPSAVVAATGQPAESGYAGALTGKISVAIYASDRGMFDLYVGDAAGSGMERVLDGVSQGEMSPNGSQIAFRGWQGMRGIGIAAARGGGRQQLTTFYEDGLPSWSPDGGRLVFSSRRESDRKSRLYQVPVGGGDYELKRGADPIWGEYPAWLANGSIVYRSTFPEQGLGIMGSDGSNGRILVTDGSATAPAGSPRGAIGFMTRRDGNWEIYRIGSDGSGLARLTNDPANDGLPAWSPDGSAIAFVSDRDGSWAVWVMAADGSGQRKLLALPGPIDGRVAGEPDYASQGWLEERRAWSR